MVSYIDEQIASAAYDNSSRSAIAELVEFFSKEYRKVTSVGVGGSNNEWEGTLTEFQYAIHEFSQGRTIGLSNNLEFVRRGMQTMEDNYRAKDKHTRPVTSHGSGGGKLWKVDVSEKYDIR